MNVTPTEIIYNVNVTPFDQWVVQNATSPLGLVVIGLVLLFAIFIYTLK